MSEGLVFPASAVALDGRALLIEGPPGSGKSSLALALIEAGAGLIGDDAVTLTPAKGALVASPPPNIGGLLEVRGVGLVSLPLAPPAPVALLLTLGGPSPERLPELPIPTRRIAGIAVPVLGFEPGTIAPAARAVWALRCHGLVFEPAFHRSPGASQ
ncbi:HPr kinase/phosphorylase [Erythrobacter sp. NE805]|uniref:HPr kinase/phosphorylase n=1 Tax=Erythrobacter sp. NE805 TaxID=3389875 RepID=UPI00396AF0B9